MLVEDVVGGGQLNLLVHLSDGSLHCYDALSASLLWQRQLSQATATLDPRLVDIDNDLHVVVATNDGSVMLLSVSFVCRWV